MGPRSLSDLLTGAEQASYDRQIPHRDNAGGPEIGNGNDPTHFYRYDP